MRAERVEGLGEVVPEPDCEDEQGSHEDREEELFPDREKGGHEELEY